jgi:microcin C transport system substrate-binding protein
MLNKYLLCIGIILGSVSGCSSDDAATEDNNKTVSALVEERPTYPASVLPEGLAWETNNEDPIYASLQARQGGTLRSFISSFPLTLRVHGPDSNTGLAGYLRPLQMSLTDLHPNTMNWVPSLATHWAYGDDGKTMYYKLNPDARWSDGLSITADDYLFTRDFMVSEYIVAPWYANQFTNEIVNISKYDDYTISVTGANVKPKEDLMYYYGISPTPRQFHKLDENWVRDYNWKIAPTPGPYAITKVEKGKYIEFSRKKEWWGASLKYNANRYNVDKIRLKVIRDIETAYRHFLRGELDTFAMNLPNYWHDKVTDNVYKNGYVNRIWFYNDIPQPSQGIYLNMDNELFNDENVRYGFAHAMNIQKMIDTVLRGDYTRMHGTSVGYGDYSDDQIEGREFDLEKADAYFNLAGWTERGSDGIRVKDGQRLAVKLTYGQQYHTDRVVVLREEAKKAGIDLQLNQLDPSSAYKNFIEKKHQAAWMGWSTGLRPQYWGGYHSVNAHKPQTNNITNTDDPELDLLIDGYRESTETKERQALAKQIQRKIHDIGAYIPTYMLGYTRSAYWRWMKLPEWHGTKQSSSLFDPIDPGLVWIDEEEMVRTKAAMKEGKRFEPVSIVDETYKVTHAID